jgi:hypothetical protein
MRISWQHRFKIPRHQRFEDYTPEEMMVEAWEQYLLENPDSLEANGIDKCVNSATGYKYYKTGDPIIDMLEAAYSRGEDPDLNEAFGDVPDGVDIFRSDQWEDLDGKKTVPIMEPPKVTWNENGEKISEAGHKVDVADFSSDDWLKQGLDEDPILKSLAKEWGINNGGST